jgi:parallel beta-helix repeat protein
MLYLSHARNRTRPRDPGRAVGVLAGTLALLASTVLLSPAARAGTVSTNPACGSTLDQPNTTYRLTRNLDCRHLVSGPEGLVVGADGVTVDLAGHAILGPNDGSGHSGVISDGHAGTRVLGHGGAIRGFPVGVTLTNCTGARVTDLTVTVEDIAQLFSSGVTVGTCTDTAVAGIHAVGTASGIQLYNGGPGNSVTDSVFSANSTGIDVGHEQDVTIADNKITNSDTGIQLGNNTGAEISGNVVSGGHDGVVDETNTATTIAGNVLTGNRYGLMSSDSDSVIRNNRANHNRLDGISVLLPQHLVLRGNTANDNAYAGITIAWNNAGTAAAWRNVAYRNQYGLTADSPVAGAHNVAAGNRTRNCDKGWVCDPRLAVAKKGAGRGTVTSYPAGIRCGAVCGHAWVRGTTVKLSAHPARGSAFAGWIGGGCAGHRVCTVQLKRNLTIAATFKRVPRKH